MKLHPNHTQKQFPRLLYLLDFPGCFCLSAFSLCACVCTDCSAHCWVSLPMQKLLCSFFFLKSVGFSLFLLVLQLSSAFLCFPLCWLVELRVFGFLLYLSSVIFSVSLNTHRHLTPPIRAGLWRGDAQVSSVGQSLRAKVRGRCTGSGEKK